MRVKRDVFTKERLSMNNFVIKNGVLTKYKGSETHVVIPDEVTSILVNLTQWQNLYWIYKIE